MKARGTLVKSGVHAPGRWEWSPLYFKEITWVGSNAFGVEEVEGNPGYYTSKFYLRPHYQLEGLTVSLRLVSKLPSLKGGA